MTGFPGSYTIIWALIILILSVLPTSDPGDIGSIPNIDKLAHIFFYATLAYMVSRDFRYNQNKPKQLLKYFPQVLLYTLAYGIFIEFVQLLLPYRSFEFMDILANAIGASCGLVIFFLFYHRRIAENK